MIRKDMLNYKDMLHWLYMRKKEEETQLESIKCILIPLYMALFSVYMAFDFPNMISKIIFICIITIPIIWISCAALYDSMQKVQFYDDFVKIIEKINSDQA